jgi:hypothetical protein
MEQVKEQFRKSDKANTGLISEDALALLIRRLCGDVISADVIDALFTAFDGRTVPGMAIHYIEFIEWLFESLETTGGALSSLSDGLEGSGTPKAAATEFINPKLQPSKLKSGRLFLSHQHTAEAVLRRNEWLEGCTIQSVKASTPPFNVRLEIPLPENCVSLNIATFGVKLPRVIMGLFESEEMIALSDKQQIPIPKYSLDNFVQKKIAKVMDLVNEARKLNLDERHLQAVATLEAFCNEFAALDDKQNQGPRDFQDFVARHVPEGWEDHLHFDSVLVANFGFDKEVSETLRTMTITVTEKDKQNDVTLEQHALRWLTKAFKGYGPVGCLTDVVNLVYAMLEKPQPEEACEQDAIDAINEFQDKLMVKQSFDNVWIPTHLSHDAESDDSLSWLLLEYIHRLHGSQLEVLIQLPLEEKVDSVRKFLLTHPCGVQTFRDKDSSNGKAVTATWSRYATLEKTS